MDPTVQVAVVGAGGTVIAAALGVFGVVLPRMRRTTEVLSHVREQVANSHDTNLRDDLDFIRDLVLDVRTDVAWVRRDHLDLSHRVALLEGEPA